jgi:hypothetical protein
LRHLTLPPEILTVNGPKKVGGGAGIRTLDRLQTYAGFQDRCIQPLCHLSEGGGSYLILLGKQERVTNFRYYLASIF